MSRLLPHYSKFKTAFLCIDLQKAFSERISNFPNCVFVANRFAAVHEIIPEHTKYIVTEQYPKGLGLTVPEVNIPTTAHKVTKTKFSCVVPDVVKLLEDVSTVVIFGIEGHVCVLQTAADLLEMNKRVVLPIDGVGSQKPYDLKGALDLMGRWGDRCLITTSESAILQLGQDAADPNFKKFAKLLQDSHPIPL